jgi:hypothetical protein
MVTVYIASVFNNKRIDDLRADLNKRIDDLWADFTSLRADLISLRAEIRDGFLKTRREVWASHHAALTRAKVCPSPTGGDKTGRQGSSF